MEIARQEIEENYGTVFGVAELGELVGITKEHLVRSFKECFGVTPGVYLTEVRIKHAHDLVISTDYPLAVISTMCGFSSEGYFGKVYRKRFGISAGKQREELAKEMSLSKENTSKNEQDEIAEMFYL